MSDRPRLADEWPTLAKVAARLLADRVAGYPRAVERERMTQADADAGIRIMRAVAEQWHRVAAREPMLDQGEGEGTLDAWYSEMRQDLARAAARAAAIASAAPDDDRKAVHAECVAALAWHQRPWHGASGTPHIVHMMWLSAAVRAALAGPARHEHAA